MIMESQLRSHVVFHLTGRPEETASPSIPAGLRPALLAPYRDLDAIRHDFPVVFATGEGEYVVSLSAAVDGALRAVAPQGTAGEEVRKRALQVEKHIRRAVASGATGALKALWDAAVEQLQPAVQPEAYRRDMTRVRDALPVEGEVAGCDGGLAGRFVRHAWVIVQREKARAARERIEHLVLRLQDVLRADHARSPAATTAPRLQESFGVAHRGLFDFAAMSRLLHQAQPRGGLPPARRKRIEDTLAVLRAQAFFGPPEDARAAQFSEFVFGSTGAALDAFLLRLPDMVQLHKAVQVAELEARGLYVEDVHDPIFAAVGEQSLTPQDLQFFPDFLVCTSSAAAESNAALAEALSSGVPLKVMVQLDDLLEQSAPGRTRFAFGMRGATLATAAMGLGEAFVLQSPVSNLVQARDAVQRGLRYPGPALLSIYAGPPAQQATVPTYLMAAAALQSRAFPVFCYDPSAGPDMASRFSLEGNPQPARDWPVEVLHYADPDLQSVSEEVAFTFVDFALCDARNATHFHVVPRADWGSGLVAVAQWFDDAPADPSLRVPSVLAVDEADLLCRAVVDDQLMRAAARCRETWHRLQELAGINDTRLERALAKERQAWEEAHARDTAAAPVTAAAATAAPATEVTAKPAETAPAEPARNPDEAYVETIRCSSCNECTLAFPKMFAYNDDKQAYIKDVKAGTYRQLVEAAESCQVSVIHPGKPWDMNEPGLEELLERAKPFA
ncbi:MAG TPA: ferredoxin [Steroidobacteraceae bacterium]